MFDRRFAIALVPLLFGCSVQKPAQQVDMAIPVGRDQSVVRLEEFVADCMTEQGFEYDVEAAVGDYIFADEIEPDSSNPDQVGAVDQTSANTVSTESQAVTGVPYHPAMPSDYTPARKQEWFYAYAGAVTDPIGPSEKLEWGGCYGAAIDSVDP